MAESTESNSQMCLVVSVILNSCVALWISSEYLPTLEGFVRINSSKYEEWQVLIYEHSTSDGFEVKTQRECDLMEIENEMQLNRNLRHYLTLPEVMRRPHSECFAGEAKDDVSQSDQPFDEEKIIVAQEKEVSQILTTEEVIPINASEGVNPISHPKGVDLTPIVEESEETSETTADEKEVSVSSAHSESSQKKRKKKRTKKKKEKKKPSEETSDTTADEEETAPPVSPPAPIVWSLHARHQEVVDGVESCLAKPLSLLQHPCCWFEISSGSACFPRSHLAPVPFEANLVQTHANQFHF